MILTYAVALVCTLGMTLGQILFKMSASASQETGSLFSFKPLAVLFAAMCLYGVTSIVWVWVLQRISLGKVYPFMALAFVFVPLGTYFLFGERFQPQYLFGVVFILIGVILTTSA
ncbi:4-amino-4-deoxy-L-arabinose-phosphoundecaprenol flippase subunit ArnE [Cupriavidus campinensis]|uniref:EamA family transporter n=1 Tax=Cupriavidus campinensis TaxID=151783 RepID=UPI001B2DCFD4|nr:EamA family transporter [Cupriavidus campinensis]CAG2142541.1 4-amino-4-deoxy-L-arabinose-phosphoundecaprenol flippase subunit ArnE [Cupriavidus campinensis]